MGYIKRKSRNVGFHSKRHAQRAAAGEVQKVLTKVAKFGLVTVTIKRHAEAFRRFAREHFPNGTENFRERREGVLSLPPRRLGDILKNTREARSSRRVMKLRPNYAARMAEVD
jgi:hypothetical protein